MVKVSGSYESVVRGVSEQNPQSRRSGQHFAQVNMISDPVRGLARRHGSWMEDEVVVPANATMAVANTASTRVNPFSIQGINYDLIARSGPSVDSASAAATFAFCFNKGAREFVPVVLGTHANVTALVTGGVSAVANVGRYVYIAGNTIIPTATTDNAWANTANQRKLAGWVRSGAYAREFKVILTKTDGSTVTGVYKTKASSYPELLDTSDILSSDTEYQKKVNDRVNAYNSEVNKWIGTAAEDITPKNIATKLREALIAAGVASGEISTQEGYILVDGASYVEIEMKDSGDDSLVRGVGNNISNVDQVSSRHYVGKVVRVEPATTAADAVYLKAFAKNGTATGFAEVVWREDAGVRLTPTSVFCIATIEDGTMYIGGTAAELSSLSGVADIPTFSANTVGDTTSSPLPTFFGKTITYMTLFQDRLVIVAGATVFLSRPGDYLNWFRQSVLSVQDDDPWEGYALGAEDDRITAGVLYDRGLLLYGEKHQYSISGRQAFTPLTGNVSVASSFAGASHIAPRASGNFVFYCDFSGTPGREVTKVHQMRPGVVADVAESFSVAQQLDKFLDGLPAELVAMTTPNMLLLRVDRHRDRLYVYTYLDSSDGGQRLFDSWSYWTWGSAVGSSIGISSDVSDILLYAVKSGKDATGTDRVWVGCERFVRDTGLSPYPYLDSLRDVSAYTGATGTASMSAASVWPDLAVAINAQDSRQFCGSPIDGIEALLESFPTSPASVGQQFPAYVTPTNPYRVDRNGQPVLAARLALNKVSVAVTDTGGLVCDYEWNGNQYQSTRFGGRTLGLLSNTIGEQPIVTATVNCTINREVKQVKYSLHAISWLPLTINSIDWTGQSFFNTRRL